MTIPTRKYVFQNGKKADANEVNSELDALYTILSAGLTADNMKDAGITKEKLSFYVSSNWRDPVATFADLSAISATDGEIRLVRSEMKIYVYDGVSTSWKLFFSAAHNDLTGKDASDAHPIASITGLRLELDGYAGRITLNESDITAIETRLTTAESDIDALETRATNLEAGVANVYTKTESNDLLSGKANASHTHELGEIDFLIDNLADKEKKIIQSSVMPTDPLLDDKWLDTSAEPYILRVWNGSGWVQIGATGGGTSSGATISDGIVSTTETWSSSKINSELQDDEIRLDNLESGVSDLNDQLSATNGTVDQNVTDIAALDTRLDTAESNISSHTSTISTHTSQINTNSQDIDLLQISKMDVGDFGLGGKCVDISGTDLNTLGSTGFYYTTSSSNSPISGVTGFISHFEGKSTSNNSYQTFKLAASPYTIYVREKASGTWTAWYKTLTENNLNLFMKAGNISFAPTAVNTVTSRTITFDTPFATTPSINVSANTGVPQNVRVSFSSPSNTGFTINLLRTDSTTTTSIYWSATSLTQ